MTSTRREEVKKLIEKYNDPFVVEVSKMSSHKIGGQTKRVEDMHSKALNPDGAQQLANKVVDGVVLGISNRYFRHLDSEQKAQAAGSYGIEVDEFNNYFLIPDIIEFINDMMLQHKKVDTPDEYIQKFGFSNYVAFLRANGNILIENPYPKQDLEPLTIPQKFYLASFVIFFAGIF